MDSSKVGSETSGTSKERARFCGVVYGTGQTGIQAMVKWVSLIVQVMMKWVSLIVQLLVKRISLTADAGTNNKLTVCKISSMYPSRSWMMRSPSVVLTWYTLPEYSPKFCKTDGVHTCTGM